MSFTYRKKIVHAVTPVGGEFRAKYNGPATQTNSLHIIALAFVENQAEGGIDAMPLVSFKKDKDSKAEIVFADEISGYIGISF